MLLVAMLIDAFMPRLKTLKNPSTVFVWYSPAGITLSMVRAKYDQFRKESGKLPNRSAYGHCFDELLNFLLSDDKVGPPIFDDGLSFFVEAGTKANAGVLDIFNKRKANDGAHSLSNYRSSTSARAELFS